jgi:hypothetical protein
MAKGGFQIPAWPFAAWLNERVAMFEARAQSADEKRSVLAQVASECGWGSEDGGLRKLYRYRHMQKGTSVKVQGSKNQHLKIDIRTYRFFRDVVEDALHHAGVDFTDLHVDYANSRVGTVGRPRDVLEFITAYEPIAEELLSPVVVRQAWCITCAEEVLLDAEGQCQWCAGAREFQAKLERVRKAQRDSAARRLRKQAAA